MQWGWMLAGLLVSCGPVVAQERKAHAPEREPDDETVVKLCNEVAYFNAMPACIHEAPAGAPYRIEYRDGRPVTVTTINGAGEPVEHRESRCARWEIAYDGEGEMVTGESCFDRAGRKRRENVVDPHDRSVEHLLDGLGQPLPIAGSNATTIVRTRDARGAAIAMTFRDVTGRRVAGRDGVYEARFEVDENGQQTSRCVFDQHGQPTLDQEQGVHCVVYKLDKGLMTGVSFQGLKREPTLGKDGGHGWEEELDARGFAVALRYFDLNGNTVMSLERGYARARREVDDFGRARVERFFDAAGSPVADQLGCEATEWRFLGKTSLLAELTCLSAHGEKRPTRGLYVTLAYRYNGSGDVIETRLLDASGVLVNAYGGFAIVRSKVDERGNELLRTYVDANRKPAVERGSGIHMVAYGYDDHERRIQTTFFDTNGVIARSEDGFARVVTEYDAIGHITRNRYFDARGAPLTMFTVDGLCVPFDKQGDGEGPPDRDRVAAAVILAKARADVEKGMSLPEAHRVHLGIDRTGDMGFLDLSDAPDVVTEALEVGELTESYEAVGGLCFLRRTNRADTKLP
jgi:hypothetical protein